MSGPVKFAEVKSAVDFLEQCVKEWENLPPERATIVTWRRNQVRAVSVEIEQVATELFDLVSADQFEDSHACRALVLAVDEFDDAFCSWAEKCQRMPDKTDPGGGSEVWEPYRQMLEARVERHYPRPEPIAALVVQKVPHHQIAKIYGWRDASGTPDVNKVQEEITAPGTHFDLSKWMHPAERRNIAEVAQQWEKRTAKQRPVRAAAQQATAPREAPESLDELIMHGIKVKQIAKMKRITEDQVRERAVELGVPLDGSVLAKAAAMARKPSPTKSEEEIAAQAEELRLLGVKDYGELGDDMEARVLALHRDKRPSGDIVKILAKAFPLLTYQKVTRIVETDKLATAK